jgi:hypothetical protein
LTAQQHLPTFCHRNKQQVLTGCMHNKIWLHLYKPHIRGVSDPCNPRTSRKSLLDTTTKSHQTSRATLSRTSSTQMPCHNPCMYYIIALSELKGLKLLSMQRNKHSVADMMCTASHSTQIVIANV